MGQALAAYAPYDGERGPAAKRLTGMTAIAHSSDTLVIHPGERFSLSCSAILLAQKPEDVRVVLTISSVPTEEEIGYAGILITEQQVTAGSVHVLMPDAPDIADHTFDVGVYVMNGKQPEFCYMGKIRAG